MSKRRRQGRLKKLSEQEKVKRDRHRMRTRRDEKIAHRRSKEVSDAS